MSNRPVIPARQRLYEAVVDWLVDRIRAREYGPGSRLPSVQELSAALGVSQTSVREALRVLEAIGVVQVRHGFGITVAHGVDAALDAVKPTDDIPARLLETIKARRVLEGETARLAAMLRSTQEMVAMAEAVENMEKSIESSEDAARGDLAFHLAVASAARNRVLTRMVHAILDSMYEAIHLALSQDGAIVRAVAEHKSILTAIKDQDADEATHRMTSHFNVIEKMIVSGEIMLRGTQTTGRLLRI